MNDEELDETFRALADALRDNQLGWIVEEVLAEIREGKVVIRVPPTRTEPHTTVPSVPFEDIRLLPFTTETDLPRRASPTTVPYSLLERVDLLVAAIRHAIVETSRFEQAVLRGLGDES